MKRVLAIVGMPGSGKGTITEHLESQGFKKIYFGGMVYEEVERRGLDIVKNEREVREDMRNQEGKSVLAKRAAKRAKEYFANGADTVVMDGLYSWSESKYLLDEFGEDLIVTAVVAPRSLRWKRASDRVDGKRQYTPELVAKRDIEEIENLEKGGPIAYADYYFNNIGTPEQLLAEVDEFIEQNNLRP